MSGKANLYSIPLGDKSEAEFGSPTFDRVNAKGKICPDAILWESLSSLINFYTFFLQTGYSNFTQILPTLILHTFHR